jgi:hypothetical protein
VTSNFTPVAELVAVILTAGTAAPLPSTTLPANEPVETWAVDVKATQAAISNDEVVRKFIRVVTPRLEVYEIPTTPVNDTKHMFRRRLATGYTRYR